LRLFRKLCRAILRLFGLALALYRAAVIFGVVFLLGTFLMYLLENVVLGRFGLFDNDADALSDISFTSAAFMALLVVTYVHLPKRIWTGLRERKRLAFHNLAHDLLQDCGIAIEIREADDDGPYLTFDKVIDANLPVLSGSEERVCVVTDASGTYLIREIDGLPVMARHSLSHETLESIPADVDVCTFVNITTSTGETCSCLISDVQIFGDERAFYWTMARGTVRKVSAQLAYGRITKKSLVEVNIGARIFWDTIIENFGSIDAMRELPVFLRTPHESPELREGISKAHAFGMSIAHALVLAIQSGDELLEATAFEKFSLFLWPLGDAPAEFAKTTSRSAVFLPSFAT
jgi:hypothetical protein